MRIQHNIMAMNAYRNYTNNVSAMKANLEKLSSGYKINRAGDDAAGLAISEKMRAQITGLETAQKNAKDGISLVQTAEGALTEVHDMLNRMVELATQSANGTYDNDTDRYQLQKEMDQLKDEINRIADSSNFNGIKLLDGSLATSGVAAASDIKVTGSFATSKSAATQGEYTTLKFTPSTTALNAGDTISYNVSLDDGTSTTVTLTMALDDSGNATIMKADDGTEYSVTTAGKPNTADLDAAILSELKKSNLNSQFKITSDDGLEFTFKSLEAGTEAPAVIAVDYKYVISGAATPAKPTALGVETTSALGEGIEIAASDIIEYDGTNYDDAVFTINGHKFVLMTEDHDGTKLGAAPNNASMNATYGLGSDVTVLVGGTDGLTYGDSNWNQNIAKIAAATGLNVTDAVDENDFGATANTGVAPGDGIRLSIGKGTLTGGLMLQIGDTADSYNQLRVGIDDCHTKAMGLDDISIAEQGDAQSAIDAIKKAINYVSDVRGTLGATQNRLDHTINNLSVMTENIQDAESTIRDTDVAEEMMAYTKNNILIQSAQAMLAQANQVPQGVLQLLQ